MAILKKKSNQDTEQQPSTFIGDNSVTQGLCRWENGTQMYITPKGEFTEIFYGNIPKDMLKYKISVPIYNPKDNHKSQSDMHHIYLFGLDNLEICNLVSALDHSLVLESSSKDAQIIALQNQVENYKHYIKQKDNKDMREQDALEHKKFSEKMSGFKGGQPLAPNNPNQQQSR